MYLPDVNVLLALAFEVHGHHFRSQGWFETAADEECVVCRVTQSSFLRLASNPALFGDEALTLSAAWECYDALTEDARFSFSLEPVGTEHLWRRLTMTAVRSPKTWGDAYLAAFAIAGGMSLVSFDTGLAALEDVPLLLLQP